MVTFVAVGHVMVHWRGDKCESAMTSYAPLMVPADKMSSGTREAVHVENGNKNVCLRRKVNDELGFPEKIYMEIFFVNESLGENKLEDDGGNLMGKVVVFMNEEYKRQSVLMEETRRYREGHIYLC